MTLRLDAFLAHAGVGGRKRARSLVVRGAVSVNGAVTRDPGLHVAGDALVEVNGTPIAAAPAAVHLVMNKAAGLSCSHDEREGPLVFEELDPRWLRAGVECVGRLDRDTTGLLILTSDGDLLHRLTHPKRKVAKRYRVTYRGALPEDAVARCAQGLVLRGEERPTRPALLSVGETGAGGGAATLVLREGRFHQVKRMFAALGVEVTALHRDRFGALDLPAGLGPGEVRELSEAELALLEAPEASAAPRPGA